MSRLDDLYFEIIENPKQLKKTEDEMFAMLKDKTMKTKTKNLITTIIGFLFLLFAGYMMFEKYEITYIGFDVAISIGLIFYKTKLYNKLIG
jgi:ABC-type Fe3+-siderophore transport system permease subunit